MRAGSNKFKELSSILHRRRQFQRTKGIVYKIGARNAMCYGAESWAMRVYDINRLETTKMRILRMKCGKTRKDKMRSKYMQEPN